MPTDQPPRRGRGRPRVRPEGVRECPVYLTDPEIAAADRLAAAAGLSRAEWLRRLVLRRVARAEKIPPKNP